MFCDKENLEKYIAFTLFDFKEYKKPDEETDLQKRTEIIYNESEEDLKDKVEYEIQDRVIWHLLENGKSVKNNYWYVADKLIKDVLSKVESEWNVAFQQFHEDLFHTTYETNDNRTIFLLGIDTWVEAFKSFFIVRASEENYEKLINLFWQKASINEFNLFFVKNINPCLYGIDKKRKLYIYLLKKINKLEFKGNLNGEKYFFVFLERSILNLYQLGYNHQLNRWMIRDVFSTCKNANDKQVVSILENIDRTLNKYKTEFEAFPALKNEIEELTVISDFIKNILKVINMEEKCLNDRSPIISTRIIDPIAEDFSRLRRLDDDKFKQELGEIKEKMNLAQIYDLLRQRKKGN